MDTGYCAYASLATVAFTVTGVLRHTAFVKLPSLLCLVLSFAVSACDLLVTRVPSAPLQTLRAEIRHESGDILEKYVEARNRLYMAGAPILMRNAALCPRRALTPGFLVHSDFDQPEKLHYVARERLNLGRDATVLAVFPHTAAYKAGLLPGDIISTFDGRVIHNAAELRARLKKIKEPRESVFGVVRNGKSFTMTLPFTPICNYPLIYDAGNRDINAGTDGQMITVTQGMADFASDDELGVVIGHELAHAVMHHIPKQKVNTGVIVIAGGIIDWLIDIDATKAMMQAYTKIWSPVFEKEADYVGLYLLARAGGQYHAAAPFWRKMAAAHGIEAVEHEPLGVYTHPATSERFAVLREAEREIDAKIKAGKPLMPELDGNWNFGARYAWWSDTREDDDEPDDSDLNH